MPGSRDRFSGFIYISKVNGSSERAQEGRELPVSMSSDCLRTVLGFIALTASLCSASRDDAVNRTHRIGTLNSWARSIQCFRVSTLAFVLSVIVLRQRVKVQTGYDSRA